jgi:DNA-binding LacI/PurR family transcriptional regulator
MSGQSSKRARTDRRARASLVEVAKAVGVSPTSVSNAYNRPDQLSDALREKIFGAAAELGYSGPDPLARNFRRGRAEALGIVVAEPFPYPLSDPYAVQVLNGVAEALEASQLALVLVPGGPARHGHAQAVRHAAVDGFILHSLLEHDALLQTALRRNLPAVIVDGPALPAVDFVGIDDRDGAAKAAQHLIDLGHRQIGVLCFRLTSHTRVGLFRIAEIDHTSSTVPRNRLHGCLDVLAGAGLVPAQIPVMECAMTNAASGRAGMAVLLDSHPQLTAVIAFSDMLALGAKQEALARGLAVPGQLSIVGFDDVLPESDELTTIRQPNRLKGRIAVERLLELLVDDASTTRHQLLPTELVVRGSTAVPRLP